MVFHRQNRPIALIPLLVSGSRIRRDGIKVDLGGELEIGRSDQRHVAITELRHKLASGLREQVAPIKISWPLCVTPVSLSDGRSRLVSSLRVPFHAIQEGQVLLDDPSVIDVSLSERSLPVDPLEDAVLSR